MARPKKPKKTRQPAKSKLDGLPEHVRKAIEAKRSTGGGKQTGSQPGANNTGYTGGAPKRTGGRDR